MFGIFPYFMAVFVLLPGALWRRYASVCVFVCFSSVVMFSSVRYDVGFDYMEYLSRYNRDVGFREPLSNLLFVLARSFGDFKYLFLLFSVLTYAFIGAAAIRRSVWFSLLYLCLPFFFIESFGIIRQALALGICIFGYSEYVDGRKKYWVWLALAPLFHMSALPFVLLVYVNNRIPSWIVSIYPVFVACVLAFIVYFFHALVSIYPHIGWYVGENSFGYKMAFFGFLLSVVTVIYCKHVKGSYILSGGAVLFVAVSVFIDAVFIRMAYYFFIPSLFIPIERFRWEARVLIGMLLVLLLCFGLYLKSREPYGPLIPYSTFIV